MYVFISYKTEDRGLAQQVRTSLALAAKCKVWWDQDLQTGGQWSSDLDAAMRDAACIVVLWSKKSVQSPWVQQEAAVAKAMQRLVPVRIDDCEIPLPYRGVQTVTLCNWNGREDDAEFSKLVRGVRTCLWAASTRRTRRLSAMLVACAACAAGFAFNVVVRSSSTPVQLESLQAPTQSKSIYLSYPRHHYGDCRALVDSVKATIASEGFNVVLPPDFRTTATELSDRIASSAAVIALYVPAEGTTFHAEVGGSVMKQARPSSWIDMTVGAARIANPTPKPVLAIQDMRVEVFGLPKTEAFLCNIAFDPNDKESLEGIKTHVETFLRSLVSTSPHSSSSHSSKDGS